MSILTRRAPGVTGGMFAARFALFDVPARSRTALKKQERRGVSVTAFRPLSTVLR